VEVVADTQSAAQSSVRRPGWDRILEMIENGDIDTIIAYQMDRITRSLEGLVELSKLAKVKNVGIITSQGDLDLTNESGRMMAGILTSVSAFEIERKGTRQRAANLQRAAAGEFWYGGFRAFGFNPDGTHKTDEAEAIRQACADVLTGTSLKAIARRWEEGGLRTGRASGKAWRLQSVRVVLLNPKNAAIRVYNGDVMGPGNWEPIIPESTHTAVKAFLTDPARKVGGNPGGKTAQNLLSGIATCDSCEAPVRAGSSRRAKVYTCAKGCVSIPRADADTYVTELLLNAVKVVGPAALFDRSYAPAAVEVTEDYEQLRKRRGTLTSALARGAIGDEEFNAALDELNAQIAEAEAVALSQSPTLRRITEGADEFVASFAGWDMATKRARLSDCVAELQIRPRGRGRRNVPIADQVEFTLDVGGVLIPATGVDGSEAEA
jgi:site-specific DNA recombinase